MRRRSFDELVNEAATADVGGWDFSWLNGRATEERPVLGLRQDDGQADGFRLGGA